MIAGGSIKDIGGAGIGAVVIIMSCSDYHSIATYGDGIAEFVEYRPIGGEQFVSWSHGWARAIDMQESVRNDRASRMEWSLVFCEW